jgi:hypothetical protein
MEEWGGAQRDCSGGAMGLWTALPSAARHQHALLALPIPSRRTSILPPFPLHSPRSVRAAVESSEHALDIAKPVLFLAFVLLVGAR